MRSPLSGIGSGGTQIQATGLSTKTGRSYLNALSGVLAYAQDLGILETNPVRDFRESLRRRAHAKRGPAEAEASRPYRNPGLGASPGSSARG